MTLAKKLSLIICSVMLSLGSFPILLEAKKDAAWECPVKKSLFKNKAGISKTLSSSDTSALSTALASTASTAGSKALALLSDIAGSQSNVANAFFNICVALTAPDSTHGNATPISLATTAVKQALSTGVISLPNDSYNYTLLHFATLFATFGGAINSSVNPIAPATTIISTLLSGLSSSAVYSAITSQDMWGSTPLHYAALSVNAGQSAVTAALLAGITDVPTRLAAVNVQNTWGYTPVHYAAAYATKSTALVSSLFTGSTATQKIAALSIQDQWLATPLHYAALFNNTAIFNKALLLGLTKSQKVAALNIKNFWNLRPADYAKIDASKTTIFDPMLNTLSVLDLKTSLTVAAPTPKFEITTVVVPTFLISQISL
jgi:hypothetical protein